MAAIVLNNVPFPASDLEDEAPNLALGRFMTAWSQVEVVCNHLFRHLAGLDSDVATIVFDNVGTKEQLAMLSELCESLPDATQRQEVSTSLKSAQEFGVKRNKLVHASWGYLNGELARFWSGLTSAHLKEIQSDSQRAKAMSRNSCSPLTCH